MNIAGPSPSYSGLLDSTGKMKPLRDPLREESLKICKHYLSKYLELVIIIDITDDQGLTSQEFKIRDITQYDKLIVSLLHLWFEYNKVYRRFRSDTTADRFKNFGNDLTMPISDNTENNEKLVLFKKLAIYDELSKTKSKADIGIINLIIKALKDSNDNDKRKLFRTQDYESTIIAKIICHILRVYFDTYFRHELFESEQKREYLLIRLYKELLIRLYEIIKLNDKHSCIHIHTGVGMNLDGDRARFCKQIQIIRRAMDNLGIAYIMSDSVEKLCDTATAEAAAAEATAEATAEAAAAAATRPGVELEMVELLPPTTDGGKSTRRRKAYKTTRRNNKHKNKKHYRRKRHTKRCKKSNRRRRSRR